METNSSYPVVLLVEDDAVVAATYKTYLQEEPLNLLHVETGADALAQIQMTIPGAIVLDLGLPDMNGIDILKTVQQQRLDCATIVITMENSVDIVVEAMRYGAFDFIEKPVKPNRLIITLRNALRHSMLSQTIERYEKTKRKQYHNLIGASKTMQAIYQIIDNVATSKASVFITGESGTGKELCAEAIHKESKRSSMPFITINCAAIPKNLMESEIFGHVKGAYTGAISSRPGAANLADGGTLFLDEIGDMDLSLQSTLLRFVQTGTFYKVGGDKLEEVNVRFICATNRDLVAEIEAGRFREDLYYRLNVIHITLPSLRERGEDILLLARKFLQTFAKSEQKSFKEFTSEVEQIFLHYEWPGNVRQLQNVIHNIVVLNEGQIVTTNMLPSPLNNMPPTYISPLMNRSQLQNTPIQNAVQIQSNPLPISSTTNTQPKPIRPFWQIERETIENAIEQCNGNVVQAANLLELSSSTIYRKLRRWKTTFTRTLVSS